MKSAIIKNVSFEDLWNRLTEDENNLCCTRKFGNDGWESFIAWNPSFFYSAIKDDGTGGLKKFVKSQQKNNHRVFGYLSYDLGYSLFNIKPRAKNDLFLPDVFFYGFDSYIKFVSDGIEVVACDEKILNLHMTKVETILSRSKINKVSVLDSPRRFKLLANTKKKAYSEGYSKIKKYIIEGDVYQINLTHRMEGETKKSSRELFVSMCEKNKVGHIAYIEGGEFDILSASPERFIKISANKTIDTFPIKGTRPRGKNKDEDEKFKRQLMNSEKDSAELNMITDLLRNDIGKIAEIGSVKVVGLRNIHPYSTVWHTHSNVQGKILPHLSSVDALISMFPGGSITGCPKKRAMEIIDEVEPTMRSVYTGSIGFIDPDDSLDFNIAIRTIIKKGNRVFLQVGGGIVYDSNKKDEYQETLDKARSFLDIL